VRIRVECKLLQMLRKNFPFLGKELHSRPHRIEEENEQWHWDKSAGVATHVFAAGENVILHRAFDIFFGGARR
jgi:hypothetical protein